MPNARRTFLRALAVVGLLAAGAFAYVSWGIAHPTVDLLPMPDGLVALNEEAGRTLRTRADARADLDALEASFEPQIYASYCGVASAVTALGALGTAATQRDFFDGPVADAHGRWSTFFGGMTLSQLGGLLAAHGAQVRTVHAGDTDLDTFRADARTNLSRAGDVLLVNYDRRELGQRGGGHISPVGAYDEASDRFLVLDVSAYKYPPAWVTAKMLFAAMNTVDSASDTTRGYAEVARD